MALDAFSETYLADVGRCREVICGVESRKLTLAM